MVRRHFQKWVLVNPPVADVSLKIIDRHGIVNLVDGLGNKQIFCGSSKVVA